MSVTEGIYISRCMYVIIEINKKEIRRGVDVITLVEMKKKKDRFD